MLAEARNGRIPEYCTVTTPRYIMLRRHVNKRVNNRGVKYIFFYYSYDPPLFLSLSKTLLKNNLILFSLSSQRESPSLSLNRMTGIQNYNILISFGI